MLNLPRVTGWGTSGIADMMINRSAESRQNETEKTKMIANALLQQAQQGNYTEAGFKAIEQQLGPEVASVYRTTAEQAKTKKDTELQNMKLEKTLLALKMSNEKLNTLTKLTDMGDIGSENAKILTDEINSFYKLVGVESNIKPYMDASIRKKEQEKVNMKVLNDILKEVETNPSPDNISNARAALTTFSKDISKDVLPIYQKRIDSVETKLQKKADKEQELKDFEEKEKIKQKHATPQMTEAALIARELNVNPNTPEGARAVNAEMQKRKEAVSRAAQPQQSQFTDPNTGNPLVFDRKSGTYKVAPVEGGGGVAPRPVNPSAGEREKTASLASLLNQVDRIDPNKEGTLYKPEYVGLVQGQTGRLTQLADEDEAAFRQVTLDVKDVLLRARSGAQINEQEYARLAKLIPSPGDTEAKYKGKLKAFRTTLETIISEREKAQRGGGVKLKTQGSTGKPKTAEDYLKKFK